jgi:chromate transporter
MSSDYNQAVAERRGSITEVLLAFLRLGLTSFGGPIAHIGYFRADLVSRRGWIDEAGFADLVALCQFLPGPASSQVGFALGVLRGGGLVGGIVAWTAFTLPSAVLLLAFAYGTAAFSGPVGLGMLHGLKLVAVAVVAQAVWGMARSLAPDKQRASIALAAVILVVFIGNSIGQILSIALGVAAGLILCRNGTATFAGHSAFTVSRRAGAVSLVLFAALLFLPPIIDRATSAPGALALFDAFYRSGALVFGGGHVVLPLLRSAVVDPGWVTPGEFLAGYGAAQAVPGPLFTFAGYLGAVVRVGPGGVVGGVIALIALSLPGMLLLYGCLPFWNEFRARPAAQAAMRGANAAVVGLLGAALYDPVWTGAVLDPRDFVVALAAFVLLTVWKVAPWIVVVLTAACGVLLGTA